MRSILILSIGLLAAAAAGSVYSRYNESRSEPGGQLWALLVAGSKGWYNYRHQADVAHAFHVLKAHGVPETNIVTMMYDDIANNPQNTFKGQLFNGPNWVDYYKDLKIDYRGDDVNPENFLNVLKGNATGVTGGNGRVIESGPEDRLFVYFTDHGAAGLIAFPNDILTTKSLNDALKWSHENKRFSDLVFYLEACESGSMFERVLPSTINVYAVSAANASQSSYSTYCDNDRDLPCLGDLFSVSWMEDSDVEDLTTDTVGQQFELVRKETELSHVCHFGKTETEADPLSWFQGAEKLAGGAGGANNGQKSSLQQRLDTAVSSRDVAITYLKRTLQRSNDAEKAKTIQGRIDEINKKQADALRTIKGVLTEMHADNQYTPFISMERNEQSSIVNYPDCHHKVAHVFRRLCVNPTEDMEYFMPHMYVLNNLCNVEAGRAHDIIEAIDKKCLETIID